MTICTRCARTLKRPPTLIGGSPYGPSCAKSVTQKLDPLEADLFRGIDLEGAVIQAMDRVQAGIEASAARHLREMRRGA